MRIDFHCHIFYEQFTPEFMKPLFKPFEGYAFYNRILSEAESIDPVDTKDPIQKTEIIAKRVGLDKIVLLSVSNKENELIKDWIKSKPNLFIPFFNPPEIKSRRQTRPDIAIICYQGRERGQASTT